MENQVKVKPALLVFGLLFVASASAIGYGHQCDIEFIFNGGLAGALASYVFCCMEAF